MLPPPGQGEFDRRAKRVYGFAAVVALLSALGWLVAVAAAMTSDWAALSEPQTWIAIGFETRFGLLWRWRLALNVVLVAFLAGRFIDSAVRIDWLVLALSTALAVSLIGAGHAGVGEGPLGPLHLVADALHLLCAGVWLGGLCGLLLLLRQGADGSRDGALATAIRRFSRIAYGAVALLLVTGSVNSLILLGRPSALADTLYGRVLLIKLGLVVVMLAVTALNRFVISPRILAGTGAGVAALRRGVMVKSLIGLMVLAAVAVLGTVHPVF